MLRAARVSPRPSSRRRAKTEEKKGQKIKNNTILPLYSSTQSSRLRATYVRS